MKKILICGATGFVGKNITLGLSGNKNYEIHAVDLKGLRTKPLKMLNGTKQT